VLKRAEKEIRTHSSIPENIPVVLKLDRKGCGYRRYTVANQLDLIKLGYKVPAMWQVRR